MSIFGLKRALLYVFSLFFALNVAYAENTPENKNVEIKNIQESKSPSNIELVMILDKSGSMYSMTTDTIGGYNTMILKQKENKIPAKVTTVLFNHNVSILYDQKALDEVPEMTTKDYETSGTTALLDAIGETLVKVDKFDDIEKEGTQVIVVIITDGMENSSKEYKKDIIKAMISERQDKKGWKFVFLGANIDAVSEAGSLGINTDNAVKYSNDAQGVRANYEAVAEFTKEVASDDCEAESSWKDKVKKDE